MPIINLPSDENLHIPVSRFTREIAGETGIAAASSAALEFSVALAGASEATAMIGIQQCILGLLIYALANDEEGYETVFNGIVMLASEADILARNYLSGMSKEDVDKLRPKEDDDWKGFFDDMGIDLPE